MKKVLTILAVVLFLGACHCTKCTRSACHMNKQAPCACAAQHKDGKCAAKHKADCKCAKCKKGGCKKAACAKHHGDCPCAHKPAPAPKPVMKPAPAPAPKPVAQKVQQDKDLAAVGKVKTNADNTAVFSFDKNINFKVNSDEIQGTSAADIAQAAKALKKYPDAKVRVVGYTDSIGEADYNLDLSKRRAKAVADLLVKEGVPAENVTSLGMGENNPIGDNKTSAGRAANRRVELEIK